jgi:type II secretory pathway pseudopilin PulG
MKYIKSKLNVNKKAFSLQLSAFGYWAFTFIEVIVSITIFSIIMISIIAIYILSSDTSAKSDINRAMHENLKSVITEIWEDIIKNWISGVSLLPVLDDCNLKSTDNYKKGTKLCLNSWNEYYLATKENWVYFRVEENSCSGIQDQCYIVKRSWENISPLTNSLVSIKDLEFFTSSQYINKVTIKIILQPTSKAWVKPNLIAESKLIFQTTISERPF